MPDTYKPAVKQISECNRKSTFDLTELYRATGWSKEQYGK